MKKLSSSPKDEKYGVKLPTTLTSQIGVYVGLPLIDSAIKRVSQEIFEKERGSFVYEEENDTYVCHLMVNEADKKATNPFFKNATDVWLVIDAHSELPLVELSESEHFLSVLAGVGVEAE